MKRIIPYCLSLVAFFLLGTGLHGQTEAVAQFDSGHVETGNPFLLHLRVADTHGEPASIDFTPWETLIPAGNILAQTGWERKDGQWVNTVRLITFDSAQLELPPLHVNFPDGGQVQTNRLELTVLPTPAPDDSADLFDIKDIRREPAFWFDYIRPYLPILIGVLVLALAIWWFLYRGKKSGLRAERHIQQPPNERALRKLAELERKQFWQKGLIKEFYTGLTYIAREYLEDRYHIPALESASEEMLIRLRTTDFPAPLTEPLSGLLQWADLAKFAKGQPPEAFHAEALQVVYQLVEQTWPPPEPETDEPEATESTITNTERL
ncbi:MAG: hypothetical protein EP344_14475 [Bacteroidetes bacterium]|nr:MAG: hypothetical protein EP344_14475 [Bacteroidota bacterium]